MLKSVVMILALMVSLNAIAEEIKVATGAGGYIGFFKPVEPVIKSKYGHTIKYVIEPAKGTTKTIFEAVLNGQADLGSAVGSWEDYSKALKELGFTDGQLGQIAHRLIGMDELKVIVHRSSGVKSLTSKQVEDIFSGKVKNYSEVGGATQEIKVYLQDSLTTDNSTFQKIAVGKQNFPSTSVHKKDYGDMISEMQTTSGSIGFTKAAFDAGNLERVALKEVIGRPALAITKGRPSKVVEEVLNEFGKRLIKKN